MYDVVIVGAGPAGLSAGIACAQHGLKVKMIDEFPRPGGRLLGQLHEKPNGTWWNGLEEAKRLHEQAKNLKVEIACGVSVYDIEQVEQGWRVATSAGSIGVPVLLLATGAAETAIPIPGWTLPGVMSIGAAQVMTNVQRVKVGARGIVVGVNKRGADRWYRRDRTCRLRLYCRRALSACGTRCGGRMPVCLFTRAWRPCALV